MRPESIGYDQESTQDRDYRSIFSSVNHKDQAEMLELREYGSNPLVKNLETIQSRTDVGLVEQPDTDEMKSDRPAKDKFAYSNSGMNLENTGGSTRNRQSSSPQKYQQNSDSGNKKFSEITTNKKHFLEDDFQAQTDTNSEEDDPQKEQTDHSHATPSRKKGSSFNNKRAHCNNILNFKHQRTIYT